MADAEDGRLPPDEAFALLGNETRLGVLRALGEAAEPLPFSALHDRVAVSDSGQFNYHLERLVGHFVDRTAEGYRLSRPGRRVVEAVLSGAVTDAPDLGRPRVEETCEYCDAPVEIEREGGSIAMYCTSCAGRYDRARGEREAPEGYLGRLPFPPAGDRDRSADEVLRAAWTWGNLEILAMAAGLCPRCGATVDTSLSVCEDHRAGEGLCETCGGRYAVTVRVDCTNCIFDSGGVFSIALTASTAMLDFLTDHGLNPVAPESTRRVQQVHADYEEEVLSTDPFRARFTFEVDGDALTLTVDDDLDVVAADRP